MHHFLRGQQIPLNDNVVGRVIQKSGLRRLLDPPATFDTVSVTNVFVPLGYVMDLEYSVAISSDFRLVLISISNSECEYSIVSLVSDQSFWITIKTIKLQAILEIFSKEITYAQAAIAVGITIRASSGNRNEIFAQ